MKFTAYNYSDHYLAIVHPSLVSDWESSQDSLGIKATKTEELHQLEDNGIEQLCHGYTLDRNSSSYAAIMSFLSRTYI